MDSKPRSIMSVAVRVASEQEPVECAGKFTEKLGGFILEFCVHNDRFTVEHSREATAIRAKGLMNYDIVLNDAVTFALLNTPYGVMKFEVKTLKREVVKLNDKLDISLQYVMKNAAAGELDRAVDVTVLFDDKFENAVLQEEKD